jgi:hypothetical protein
MLHHSDTALPEQVLKNRKARLPLFVLVSAAAASAAAAAAAARWSTGVLAYELVAGAPPFMHEDRMVMYRRIVDGVFSCPTHFSAVSALHRFVQCHSVFRFTVAKWPFTVHTVCSAAPPVQRGGLCAALLYLLCLRVFELVFNTRQASLLPEPVTWLFY